MTLLDTNVLIYASERESPYHEWARAAIAEAVDADGGGDSTPSAWREYGVGVDDASTVVDRIRAWGIAILDLPVAAADPCAAAYSQYRAQRWRQSGSAAPRVPLPDFFIGAHAQVMGWTVATAGRAAVPDVTFPSIRLTTP